MKFDFKPTKWNVAFCQNCNALWGQELWCDDSHTKVEFKNVPFLASDMRLFKIKKWAELGSKKRNKDFKMSPSNLEKVVLNCGIKPGGMIPDQWWMFGKLGGVVSLVWLGPNDNS